MRRQWEGEGDAAESVFATRASFPARASVRHFLSMLPASRALTRLAALATLLSVCRRARGAGAGRGRSCMFSSRAKRRSRSPAATVRQRASSVLAMSLASSGEMTPSAIARSVAVSEAATASPPAARSSSTRRRRAGGRRRTRQKRNRPGSPLSRACSTTARVNRAGPPPHSASASSVALLRPRGRPAGLPDWPF